MPRRPARVLRPAPRPLARQALLCFSFCGGGTSRFRPWVASLADDTELVLFCYPGREGRFTEPFATTWSELIDDALAAVASLACPYVLLGHSMGAWVAFDTTLRAAREGLPTPRALVVSAADAPFRWAAKRDRPPRLRDTDAQLLRWMTEVGQLPAPILAEPDLCDMAVEVFRADLRLSDAYRYQPGARVDVPVEVLYGAEDRDAGRAAALRWREVAAGPLELHELPGGHFYTEDVWTRLPAHVAALAPVPDAL